MPAHCDDNIPADSIWRNVDLEQVVVTGTRTPKLLAQTPVLTQVISQKDIQKADATDLKDLLQQVMPGVEFSYAMNQQVHLNLSGFGGQNVLILVDGERLAGETMDNVDFARIGMDNVDHIEIVKGAASALYGSNANGGVV
ncbi:TonB-dependent receptor plug domain-containing protein, partial [Prevotella corporis]